MTQDQFEAMIVRLDHQAKERPKSYQRKVLLLSLLGNAYIALVLSLVGAVLVALTLISARSINALVVKGIFLLVFFLWVVLRALWVKVEPPAGTEIHPGQAPELFFLIDGLRKQLGAPRFHHVLIDDDFNAGVVQSPRLGIFGWPRNYLQIGLPLMKSLSVEQLKAVLAHEFGHLARGHGSVSNWIYRQRLRWARLFAMLETTESFGRFMFQPFLKWFVPYFNAYSFPLARVNEYQADATSARLTSRQTAAAALTSVNVIGSYLAERYWPQIHKLADEQARPAFAPYFDMGAGLASGLDEASALTWQAQAMSRKTTSTDTHPALQDRLAALGANPVWDPPTVGQAADQLLGAALPGLTENFDQRWQARILPSWEARHEEVKRHRELFASLNSRVADGETLTVLEATDRALLTEVIQNDPEGCLAQLRQLNVQAPNDAGVCMHLGRRLLSSNDSSGFDMIKRTMQLSENTIADGCVLLRDYCFKNDRPEEAKNWHQHLLDRVALEQGVDKEKNTLRIDDNFEGHALESDALSALQAQLKLMPGLHRVFFVRKRLKTASDKTFFVLAFGVTGFWQRHNKQRALTALQSIQVASAIPGGTLIINVDKQNKGFVRKFKSIPGSRIF